MYGNHGTHFMSVFFTKKWLDIFQHTIFFIVWDWGEKNKRRRGKKLVLCLSSSSCFFNLGIRAHHFLSQAFSSEFAPGLHCSMWENGHPVPVLSSYGGKCQSWIMKLSPPAERCQCDVHSSGHLSILIGSRLTPQPGPAVKWCLQSGDRRHPGTRNRPQGG